MQIIQNAVKNNKTAIVLVPEISLTPQMVDRLIIDEEHDSSYKSDMAPRYKAQDIAKYLAKENDIPLVLR